MATNVSPLANDLELNRGDRKVQKPVVIDLYNSSMGVKISVVAGANINP